MLLIYAIMFIEFEAIIEALIKRFSPKLSEVVFDNGVQWVIALVLFGTWMYVALQFDAYYVPLAKMVLGFVFVRFLVFDFSYNIIAGNPINYYGTKKLYDRTMTKLADYGIFLKLFVFGPVGVVFLLGLS